jgi:hypothetical protein
MRAQIAEGLPQRAVERLAPATARLARVAVGQVRRPLPRRTNLRPLSRERRRGSGPDPRLRPAGRTHPLAAVAGFELQPKLVLRFGYDATILPTRCSSRWSSRRLCGGHLRELKS